MLYPARVLLRVGPQAQGEFAQFHGQKLCVKAFFLHLFRLVPRCLSYTVYIVQHRSSCLVVCQPIHSTSRLVPSVAFGVAGSKACASRTAGHVFNRRIFQCGLQAQRSVLYFWCSSLA